VPDPASLIALGLVGLFVAAFLAGSVLPFPSEVVLVALLGAGASPSLAVVVATLGNVLGAASIYALAVGAVHGRRRWAGEAAEEAEATRARRWIQRGGAGALLFSWVPVVGDALVLGAGLAGVRAVPFFAFVTAGKAGSYVAVALTTLEILK
jgi:membrane protein YqaA with SNARE-associated domain